MKQISMISSHTNKETKRRNTIITSQVHRSHPFWLCTAVSTYTLISNNSLKLEVYRSNAGLWEYTHSSKIYLSLQQRCENGFIINWWLIWLRVWGEWGLSHSSSLNAFLFTIQLFWMGTIVKTASLNRGDQTRSGGVKYKTYKGCVWGKSLLVMISMQRDMHGYDLIRWLIAKIVLNKKGSIKNTTTCGKIHSFALIHRGDTIFRNDPQEEQSANRNLDYSASHSHSVPSLVMELLFILGVLSLFVSSTYSTQWVHTRNMRVCYVVRKRWQPTHRAPNQMQQQQN